MSLVRPQTKSHLVNAMAPSRLLQPGISIVSGGKEGHQLTHARAVERGLIELGIIPKVVPTHAHVQTSSVVCWGWRAGQRHHNRGRDVLVLERGYVGDRFEWTSLGLNGLNGLATHAPTPNEPTRFERHHSHLYEPWRGLRRDLPVLIVGQVPGDASLRGRRLDGWYRDAGKRAKMLGYESKFRPHPMAMRWSPAHQQNQTSILDDVYSSSVVVTWNSNSAVDALLAGVPTVCYSEGGMAYDMCPHSLQKVTGDEPKGRRQWAERLAWLQYKIDEIATGEPLAWYADRMNLGGVDSNNVN